MRSVSGVQTVRRQIASATRWAIASIGFLMATIVAVAILQHPDRAADRLLRIGGRIVQKGANEIESVAITFIVVLVTVWVVIGLRCAWEARIGARVGLGRSVAEDPAPR